MYRLLLVITFVISTADIAATQNLTNQSTDFWEKKLKSWATEHFYDCFNYSFVKYQSLDKIYKDPFTGKYVIQGIVINLGNSGKGVSRTFKATLEFKDDSIQILFVKEMRTIWGRVWWKECNKEIDRYGY